MRPARQMAGELATAAAPVVETAPSARTATVVESDSPLAQAGRPGAAAEGAGMAPTATAALLILLFSLLAPTVVYWQTALSMGALWWREDTYAHGFLVVPFVLYMAWRSRDALARVDLRPSGVGMAAVAACGFGWLLASVASVAVGTQFMLVGSACALVLALGGWGLLRALMFPLGFLVFAVPFGQVFTPHLIEFTADFAVATLRLTGIPVYREGTFFTIPTGQWSVVDACSGIRYLLASLMLGTVFAYLNYTRPVKRAVFITLSAVVPVLANGMRAYIIVMIAHLSSNELAHGVDHFVYGWVWFGVVVTVLFWVGSYWRDPPEATPAGTGPAAPERPGEFLWKRSAVAAALCLGLLVLWPTWNAQADRLARSHAERWPAPSLPEQAGGWAGGQDAFSPWQPNFQNAAARLGGVFAEGGEQVGVEVAYYPYSRQDAELVNAFNYLVHESDPKWRTQARSLQRSTVAAPARVQESLIVSRNQRMVVWRWHFIAGDHTESDTLAKVLESEARLTGGDTRGFGMVVYTTVGEEPGEEAAGRERLARFLAAALPDLQASLQGGTAEPLRTEAAVAGP